MRAGKTLNISMIRIFFSLARILGLTGLLFSAHMSFCPAEEKGEEVAGMRVEVFTVQHAEAGSLLPVVESLKSAEGKITVHATSNNIIVYDYPGPIARIEKVIRELDKPLKQVEIKVLVVESASELLKSGGINLTSRRLAPDELEKAKYLVSNDSRAELRSEMTVTALSGEPAALGIGQEEIFPGSVRREDGALIVTTQSERKAGDYLEVTPIVNNDGTITVTVSPTVSEFTGEQSTRERSILTRAVVASGDTIVLGGVNSSSQDVVREGLPLTEFSVGKGAEVSRDTLMFLTVTAEN